MKRALLEDRYGRQISALLILVVFLGVLAVVGFPVLERLGLRGPQLLGTLAAVAVGVVVLVNIPNIYVEVRNRRSNPLCYAAYAGKARKIDRLLKRGANADEEYAHGSTPLSISAQAGDVEVVRVLLDHGATVDPRDGYQSTPLIDASERGFTEIVRLLVEAGADLEAADRHGRKPLDCAILRNHPEVVRLLLEAGVDTQNGWRNEDGETSLELAESRGLTEVVELIRRRT